VHSTVMQGVDITSKENVEVTYTFGVARSLGFELLIPFDNDAFGTLPMIRSYAELEPKSMVPTVQVPESLVVGPGETKTAT